MTELERELTAIVEQLNAAIASGEATLPELRALKARIERALALLAEESRDA